MLYKVNEDGEINSAFLRTGNNYDMNAASNETGIACTHEEGKTQQEFRDECDINEIVRRFGLTGELPENYRAPVSGDFTGITDFQTAMNAVRAAEEAFMQMPATQRAEFDNDPQKLIKFLDNPKNRERALEMGLIQQPPEKTRDVIAAIDEMSAKLAPATPPTPKEK